MKKTVQSKIPEEEIKKLEIEAKRTGHTVSSIIRFLVKEFLRTLKEKSV